MLSASCTTISTFTCVYWIYIHLYGVAPIKCIYAFVVSTPSFFSLVEWLVLVGWRKQNSRLNSLLNIFPNIEYITQFNEEHRIKPIFDKIKLALTNFQTLLCLRSAPYLNTKKHLETHCQNSNVINVKVTTSNDTVIWRSYLLASCMTTKTEKCF